MPVLGHCVEACTYDGTRAKIPHFRRFPTSCRAVACASRWWGVPLEWSLFQSTSEAGEWQTCRERLGGYSHGDRDGATNCAVGRALLLAATPHNRQSATPSCSHGGATTEAQLFEKRGWNQRVHGHSSAADGEQVVTDKERPTHAPLERAATNKATRPWEMHTR